MAEREFAGEIVSTLKSELEKSSQRSTRVKTLLSWFETPEGKQILVSLEDKIVQLLKASETELSVNEIIQTLGWEVP